MNCYDLVLKYFRVIGDMDRAIEKKSKAVNQSEHDWLDTEINKLELEMIEIKSLLKSKDV